MKHILTFLVFELEMHNECLDQFLTIETKSLAIYTHDLINQLSAIPVNN